MSNRGAAKHDFESTDSPQRHCWEHLKAVTTGSTTGMSSEEKRCKWVFLVWQLTWFPAIAFRQRSFET